MLPPLHAGAYRCDAEFAVSLQWHPGRPESYVSGQAPVSVVSSESTDSRYAVEIVV